MSALGDDLDRDAWCVLGLPIDRITLAEAVIAVEAAVRDRRRLSFVTPNLNWLVRALRSPDARQQIINSDLSLADGGPLVALARLLGAPIPERVAGADLFEALRARPGFAGRRMRVFFFGGRKGSAEAAAAAIDLERGGLEAAGWFDPGHGDIAAMSAPEIIDSINRAAPDFLVVSLGAAKGQAWIERNQGALSAPVIAHLGAVVDFTAGAIRRAPKWVARAGLEWAWRIAHDPALWRRYASDSAHLTRFLATRALPLRLARSGSRSGVPAAASAQRGASGATVRLSGDLVEGQLGAVREAFRSAAAAAADLRLDLTSAGAIDASFLGLVLLLEKALGRKGATIRIAGMNKRQRLLFRSNAMTYPEELVAPQQSSVAKADAAAG